jgi:hypothetical protein
VLGAQYMDFFLRVNLFFGSDQVSLGGVVVVVREECVSTGVCSSAGRRGGCQKGVRDFCVTFSRAYKHYWAFGCSERQ